MKTVTFYSYKGGVGRSLALANIATRLSEFNKKVCLLDFDLEAPGLQHKFSYNLEGKEINYGIVDYIFEYCINGILPTSIRDFSLDFSIYENKASVNFIPAGNTNSPDYWKKLSAINWYNLLYENENGIAFFLDLKEKIKKEFNPDFLLIDSRTGITETAGITISILADEIVILAANNRENFYGAQKIINSITDKENSVLGKIPKITFVLSRIPYTDNPDDKAKEQNLVKRVKTYFDERIVKDINLIHSDRDLEEFELLKINYDEEENSSQISRDYLNLFEKITQNELTPNEIQKFNDIKLSEKLFSKAIDEKEIETKFKYLNEAIRLNPENIDFYSYRLAQYAVLKKYTLAAEDCEKILQIKSNHLQAFLWLAEIYNINEEYDNALKILSKAKGIVNEEPAIYNTFAKTYMLMNESDKAVELLNKAIELDPSNSIYYNNRADAYRLLNNYDAALNDVYKAIEFDSSAYINYFTLAEINAHLKKENEFYVNLEVALKLAVENNKISNAVVESIQKDKVYSQFRSKERFQKILDKYNIQLLDEEGI